MNTPHILINTEIFSAFAQAKQMRVLYSYVIASRVMGGRGFCSQEELLNGYMQVRGCSKLTAKRNILKVREYGYVRFRKGNAFIIGRKQIERFFNRHGALPEHLKGQLRKFVRGIPFRALEGDCPTTGNKWIRINEGCMKSYKSFQHHLIQQTALLEQERFATGINLNKKKIDSESLCEQGKVNSHLAIVRDGSKAGCSLSNLVKKLGMEAMTISNALKGCAEKQYGESAPIYRSEFKKKFSFVFDKKSRGLYSFTYNKKSDTYKLRYPLARRIEVKPSIKSKRSRLVGSESESMVRLNQTPTPYKLQTKC